MVAAILLALVVCLAAVQHLGTWKAVARLDQVENELDRAGQANAILIRLIENQAQELEHRAALYDEMN